MQPQSKQAQQVTPERLMQFAWSYAPPIAIEAAIQNRVFDVLDERPRTVDELAQETGSSKRGLRALMNMLVGLGLLEKATNGSYRLTPESSTFLVTTKPSFSGGIFRHMSSHLIPRWLHLSEILRTGEPATKAETEDEGAEFFAKFVEDIASMSVRAAQVLADALRIPEIKRPFSVLDLGAGSGVWGITLAKSSPHVKVTCVDFPLVLDITRKAATRSGVADRFAFVAGDLLQAQFGTGHNLATVGHILHSEGERRSRALLKRTFDTLAPGGNIAIAEFLVNDNRSEPLNGLIFAVNMLVNTSEGDTYSFDEIGRWLRDAGFVNMRTLEAPGPSPLILADKPT